MLSCAMPGSNQPVVASPAVKFCHLHESDGDKNTLLFHAAAACPSLLRAQPCPLACKPQLWAVHGLLLPSTGPIRKGLGPGTGWTDLAAAQDAL